MPDATRAVVAVGAYPHFYDVALAAQDAGFPGRLYTRMYWKKDSSADWLLRLPSAMRRRFPTIERLRGRRKADLNQDRVCPVDRAELVTRLPIPFMSPAMRWRAHRRLLDSYAARRLKPGDGLVHGTWGSSHQTFRRAKQIGVPTILDVPYVSPDELTELWRRELSTLGLPPDIPTRTHPAETRHYIAELQLADTILVGLEGYKHSAVAAGAAVEKIRVVPYGFDTRRFQYVARPRRSTFRVLYVGPINPTKGLHYLIEAFQLADIPDSTLHLVGALDPATVAYFRPAIVRLGARVIHETHIPHAELMRAYASADVFAFPSMVGGIGVAICEAMATGLPVITTDGDVVVRDGVDGLVVPARDVAAWAATLERIAAEREWGLALGVSASQRVKHFTRESFRRNLAEIYRQTMASGS